MREPLVPAQSPPRTPPTKSSGSGSAPSLFWPRLRLVDVPALRPVPQAPPPTPWVLLRPAFRRPRPCRSPSSDLPPPPRGRRGRVHAAGPPAGALSPPDGHTGNDTTSRSTAGPLAACWGRALVLSEEKPEAGAWAELAALRPVPSRSAPPHPAPGPCAPPRPQRARWQRLPGKK
jgi:hypothetical protein